MRYKVDDLKREIRIAIDENSASTRLLEAGDIDTLSLEEIIGGKITEAARLVETNAPVHLLGEGKPLENAIGWKDRKGFGPGYMLLPDDFMRLVSFQMSDWSRQVSVMISEDEPLYAQQQSRFAGVRGCPQRPVVALTNQPVGRYLEFYSCNGGEGVYLKRGQYLPMPRIKDGMIDIPEMLKSAVVMYAAGLTAMSIQQTELSQNMFNLAKEFMQ